MKFTLVVPNKAPRLREESEMSDALLEREAKRLGISVTQLLMLNAVSDDCIRDIAADGRKGISQSQSMIAERPEPTPTRKSDRGWVNERPLTQPPGVTLIDRMCEAQDAKDRQGR